MGRTLFGNRAGGGRRLAAWLAPLLVLALWAAEAKAQSTVLVSNFGQGGGEGAHLATRDYAQKFTSGGHAAGYTLTSVDLYLLKVPAAGTESAAPRVRVVRGAATGSSSVAVATLTAGTTAIASSDEHTFTAPANTTLLPSTDYWIVVEAASSGGGHVYIHSTLQDGEDSTSAAGWSIDNSRLQRAHDSTGAFTANTRALRISVNGSSVNTPATGAPAIAGTATVGQSLQASRGTIADVDGVPSTFSYQWVRVVSGTESDISGATSSSYLLGDDDLGNRVKVKLSFTDNAGHAETRTSAAFPASGSILAPPNSPATGAPEITGAPTVGQSLQASRGTIADPDGVPSTFSYQWVRVDSGTESDISGATSSSYLLDAADEDMQVKVKLSFTDNRGHAETRTSAAYPANGFIAPVTNTPATGRPAIAGTPTVGQRLEASRGTIADVDGVLAQFSYQWVRVDSGTDADISGATASRYRLDALDAGKQVKVKLFFFDSEGAPEARTSAAYPANGTIAPAPAPDIGGAALVGNLGQTPVPGADVLTQYDSAQKFTTGANAGGYDLSGVELRLSATASGLSPPVARVFRGAAAGSGAVEVAMLTARVSALPHDTANIAYAAPPNTVLSPSTDYWLVVEDGTPEMVVEDPTAVTRLVSFELTTSDSEDAASAPGWSIDDAGLRRDSGSTGAFAARPQGASYMIRIHGAPRPGTAIPPPTAADGSVRTRPDTAYTFRAADFNFAGAPGRSLASVRIETVPAAGTGVLTLAGSAVAAGQVVDRGDIDAGNFGYAPPAGEAGEDFASFTFRVNDGNAFSDDPYTMTVHVAIDATGETDEPDETVANRAPVAADGSVRIRRDTGYAFRVGDFGYSDADGDALAGIAIRTLTGLPAGSSLELDGAPVRAGHIVTRARLEAGGLVFAPAAGGTGSPYARFAFTVSDGSADSAPATMTIHVFGAVGERAVGAWMPRFGRTVTDQVLAAVEGRMRAARRPAAEVSLGGTRIGLVPPSGEARGVAPEPARRGATRTMGGDELLLGSSFSLTGAAAGGGTASVWGRGAVTRFDGREDGLAVDGEVTSAMLGGDWRGGALTAGLVVAHSLGEGRYRERGGGAERGTVEATLTGLYPWLRHALSDRLEAWGAAGYGWGELTLDPPDGPAVDAGLSLWMAAGGLRGTLLGPGGGGLVVTGKTDAMIAGASTGAAGSGARRLAAVESEVTRLRLGLEGALPLPLGEGSVLTPGFELGARHDGGDAETGFGADIGARLAWADPAGGLAMELSARGLLTHAAKGFRQRGLSAALSWAPGTAGRGPRVNLSQSFGGASAGGADALLGRAAPVGLAAAGSGGNDLRRRRLEARLGYGLAAFGGGFTFTPEAGFGLSNAAREYSIGWRLARRPGPVAAELAFEARRSEPAGAAAAAVHEARARLTARF